MIHDDQFTNEVCSTANPDDNRCAIPYVDVQVGVVTPGMNLCSDNNTDRRVQRISWC